MPHRESVSLEAGQHVNQGWALDFMRDAPFDGQTFRTLRRLVDWYGAPYSIRLEVGAEITNPDFTDWATAMGIALRFIELGEPNQNTDIEPRRLKVPLRCLLAVPAGARRRDEIR